MNYKERAEYTIVGMISVLIKTILSRMDENSEVEDVYTSDKVRIPHTYNDLKLEVFPNDSAYMYIDGKRLSYFSLKDFENNLDNVYYAIRRDVVSHLVFEY